MLYHLNYETTHWERGQFIKFISPVRSESDVTEPSTRQKMTKVNIFVLIISRYTDTGNQKENLLIYEID